MQDKRITQASSAFVKELRLRIDWYFRIVVKSVKDSVPKLIGNFLVRAIQNKLTLELHSKLMENQGAVDKLLGEPKEITEERHKCKNQL